MCCTRPEYPILTAIPPAKVFHLEESEYVRLLTREGVDRMRMHHRYKNCIYIDLGHDLARTFVMLTKLGVETWLGWEIVVLPACDILPVSRKLDHLPITKSLRTTLERKMRHTLGKDDEDED